jgi:transaldolase
MRPTGVLHDLGQSLWLDNITRELLNSGMLQRFIEELSVTGLTSNPTIFDHAIRHSATYDDDISRKTSLGKSADDLFFELALADLTRAAELFQPVFVRTEGVDGWVSLEVSPLLAHDTQATLAAARALYRRGGKPNLFIKIPGTLEGLAAIEAAIFAGVPVNVTLLFSREQYLAAAGAYLNGIERRIEAGLNPAVASVASVFVSRWDVAVSDKVPRELSNQLGIAVAQRIYSAYHELLASARFQRAANAGEYRHQGPDRLRHPLCEGPCGAIYGQHHAGGHVAGIRRPRRSRRDARAGWGRVRAGSGQFHQGGYRHRRARVPASGRGRGIVCEVMERPVGLYRIEARHDSQGELTK